MKSNLIYNQNSIFVNAIFQTLRSLGAAFNSQPLELTQLETQFCDLRASEASETGSKPRQSGVCARGEVWTPLLMPYFGRF